MQNKQNDMDALDREIQRREIEAEIKKRNNAANQANSYSPSGTLFSPMEHLIPSALSGLGQFGNDLDQKAKRFLGSEIGTQDFPLASILSKLIPNISNEQISKFVGAPDTFQGRVTEGIARNAPYFAAPGLAVEGKLAEAIPSLGRAQEALKGIPVKLAKSYLGEEERPQEPSQLMGPGTSEDIKKALVDSITEGRTLPQTQRLAAKEIRNARENQENISQENFERFFNYPHKSEAGEKISLGDTDILPREPGYLGLVKPALLSPSLEKSFDKDTQGIYNKFTNKSTVRNGHKLQSQLGSDIGSLNYKKTISGLDQVERNKLSDLKTAFKQINNLMDSAIEGTPYEGEYRSIKKFHKENVIPFREGAIAKISSGEVKNPGNLSNIFKNREESIARVLRHLGPGFKPKILHAELGEIGQDIKPNKLIALERDLREKGLGSYLTKEHKDILGSFRNKHELEETLKNEHAENLKSFESQLEGKKDYKRAIAALIGTGLGASMGANPATIATLGTLGYLSKPVLDRISRAIVASKRK